MTDPDRRLRDVEDRQRRLEDEQRRHGQILATLEDRTAANGRRLIAIEEGIPSIQRMLGQLDERTISIVRQLRNGNGGNAHSPPHPLTHLADWKTLLLGAILIGMALGRAGIDPSTWFR